KLMAEEEMGTSRATGSKPNIPTENRHVPLSGRPPISKRPSASVMVVILSDPQVAVTVAPGIPWPPERTTPFCTSATARAVNMKTKHDERSMHEFLIIRTTQRRGRVVPVPGEKIPRSLTDLNQRTLKVPGSLRAFCRESGWTTASLAGHFN